MNRIWMAFGAGVVLASLVPKCQADEPPTVHKPVIVAPPVYQLMPPMQGTTGNLPPTIPTRQDRYQPWQNYGVSRTGHSVPRVLMLPDGEAFWAYDGKPYYWLTTHMSSVTPFFLGL